MSPTCSRREFLAAALVAPVAPVTPASLARMLARDGLQRWVPAAADAIRLPSPNGAIEFHLLHGDEPGLRYRITFRDRPVIEASPLSIVVDGVDLALGVEAGKVSPLEGNERYAWRGAHAEAINRYRGASIALRHAASATDYVVEVRVFDDGVGFRCIVPGTGSRVPDERTTFVLPAGSTVWYHDLRGHYEGVHTRRDIAQVQAGEWAAPPLTFKLGGEAGYGSITEAAVINYSGMALQADGQRGFRTRLGHAQPASYPFTLRYGDAEAARLAQPAAIVGPITTPWRVVMIGPDLNTLDLVEGFWQRWSEGELRELIDYSRQRNVGIWLWKHSREIRDPEARAAFLAHVQDVGAVGVKIDFFDHEAKEVMDLYQAALRGAAEHRLMVDFHGANKPTGESRTWPNELTREAVSGMERKSMPAWSQHDTTIPFTRMLAGPLDFTPMLFGERRRETSWAHQIATAAMFTSPLLVYGAHPRAILEHPAADLIKSIPSIWDETRVLPFSEIGEVAAFARRNGERWFLVIANGPTARSVEVSLAFLGDGDHNAILIRDQTDEPAAVRVEHATVRAQDSLRIDLRAAGGFVARI